MSYGNATWIKEDYGDALAEEYAESHRENEQLYRAQVMAMRLSDTAVDD
jgi:hypothetical protein